ncbi:MAG: selenocysteine-specific translation elongation factor [Anaerolineales bacterium]|nr:selenocysteine-specific translation elongation factor [Anaerolineales bacterium]
MYVIGTAGHVDHGKSTLVMALTGIDPDRLREEKEREMTIDLGFAWLTLPNGETVGVIDVPGHIDFIENMLAGVGGVDAALFVVAADEGVMPQTREHLAILDLLEVRSGVVALTKSDLAESEEWLELVAADVSETLAGTVLADAPIIPVSARTGNGLDQLRRALQDALATVEPPADRGRPRLPVDRVFSISGFGTVATGTLLGGSLIVGQEVEILPKQTRARIRGLQTHKQKVEQAAPGSRVAVNLSGINKADLQRGDVIASPGWLRPTVLVDVQLRYLTAAEHRLRHNTQLKFFSGAAETMAHVRLLAQDSLAPGESGWAQLRLRDPIPLTKGDRFIVRLPSPAATVGGGIVVDPHPGQRHRRYRADVLERLETLAQGTPEEVLLQAAERTGPTPVHALLATSGLGDRAMEALRQLLDQGDTVLLGDQAGEAPSTGTLSANSRVTVVTRGWWATTSGQAVQELGAYHRKYPLRQGMPREALRSSLRLETKVFNAFLDRAASDELIVDREAFVWLPSHEVRLSPEQEQQVAALLARFRQEPYSTPSVKESASAVGEEVLDVLIERGQLVQASAEILFLSETYTDMVARIRNHIQQEGSVTLAHVRDMFGTSRKYAQSILEHLDESGVTRRVGDVRVLRSA